jgi:hypothetical protein
MTDCERRKGVLDTHPAQLLPSQQRPSNIADDSRTATDNGEQTACVGDGAASAAAITHARSENPTAVEVPGPTDTTTASTTAGTPSAPVRDEPAALVATARAEAERLLTAAREEADAIIRDAWMSRTDESRPAVDRPSGQVAIPGIGVPPRAIQPAPATMATSVRSIGNTRLVPGVEVLCLGGNGAVGRYVCTSEVTKFAHAHHWNGSDGCIGSMDATGVWAVPQEEWVQAMTEKRAFSPPLIVPLPLSWLHLVTEEDRQLPLAGAIDLGGLDSLYEWMAATPAEFDVRFRGFDRAQVLAYRQELLRHLTACLPKEHQHDGPGMLSFRNVIVGQ